MQHLEVSGAVRHIYVFRYLRTIIHRDVYDAAWGIKF